MLPVAEIPLPPEQVNQSQDSPAVTSEPTATNAPQPPARLAMHCILGGILKIMMLLVYTFAALQVLWKC